MKRILLLSVLCLALLSSAFASDLNPKYLNYASSLFLSNYGYSVDKGQMEYGVTLKSSFPNLFNLFTLDGLMFGSGYDSEKEATIPYGWEDAKENLALSLTCAFFVEGSVRYDILKSKTHDLDVGVALAAGLVPAILPDFMGGAILEGTLRYAKCNEKGNGLFVELNTPLLGVLSSVDRDEGCWVEPLFIFAIPEIAVLWDFYAGLSLGYRWTI